MRRRITKTLNLHELVEAVRYFNSIGQQRITNEEIAEATGFTVGQVHAGLRRCAALGLIERTVLPPARLLVAVKGDAA